MKWLSIVFAFIGASASAAALHNGHVNAGMSAGGFNFGVGYEYMYNQSQGLGGHFHYYSKDDKKAANGFMIIGAMTGFHFFKGDWDFALSPSLDIVNVDSVNKNVGNKTGLGPGLSIALMVALNEKVAIGFDHVDHYIWFGDDYRGHILSDMNFRLKIGF